MIQSIRRSLLLASFVAIVGLPMVAFGGGIKWVYPAIQGYGPVHPFSGARVMPNKHRIYKAIFDVTKGTKDFSKPNPGLVHVARAVNVFAEAGVPLNHLRFVAIVHGPATASILNNKAYMKKYGVANPNIKLISALRRAGVSVGVCGQALADNDFPHVWVNKEVAITLSALSTVVIYGDKGYAYMKQ